MLVGNLTRKTRFEVSVADNFISQTKGLSFSEKKNILFKFPMSYYWSFWMFGVPYNIDIAFIDESKRVFQIEKAVPLTLNPRSWRAYKPKKPCKFVLETTQNIVHIGDKLDF